METPTLNPTEADEIAYLLHVQGQLSDALRDYETRLRRIDRSIRDQKAYLGENKSSMDHAEKAEARQTVNREVVSAEVIQDTARKIRKLVATPYFGRFDFLPRTEPAPRAVYIGIHTFADPKHQSRLIFDWRAPIATLFYDYELGDAQYEAPAGKVEGTLTLKRQYRIRNGTLQFMIESGLNIQDDVLQEELSRASDDKMKHIVATIQRDQNAIIRNEEAQALIIQGVAGSGKTSIALHRIAFLLYRFKEELASKDILIISPNKVFGDYISNVLPELGEEQVAETEMEALAADLLDSKHKFQTFFEQASLLVETYDEALQERIREKSTLAFLARLNRYVAHVQTTRFTPADVVVRRQTVPASVIATAYRTNMGRPTREMIQYVTRAAELHIANRREDAITTKERNAIRAAVRKMCTTPSPLKLYQDFFAWWGRPELFKKAKGGKLEYADVFPLIHLTLQFEGGRSVRHAPKHLLVDEMQDYSAVHYAVLDRIFPCKKTVLGDASQAVNPFSASTAGIIQEVLRESDCVHLHTSYRSSYEITQFAQTIHPNADLVAIKRHGECPAVLACADEEEEVRHMQRLIEQAHLRGYQTTGVICKTQGRAAYLHERLKGGGGKMDLLTARSSSFHKGVVFCTAHLAKGLEFDQVIVPHANAQEYHTLMDRNLLYVACTRAMHRLTVTHVGEKSPLLP